MALRLEALPSLRATLVATVNVVCICRYFKTLHMQSEKHRSKNLRHRNCFRRGRRKEPFLPFSWNGSRCLEGKTCHQVCSLRRTRMGTSRIWERVRLQQRVGKNAHINSMLSQCKYDDAWEERLKRQLLQSWLFFSQTQQKWWGHDQRPEGTCEQDEG